jgi:ABC-type multidrug transport system fused ATPase/permease subunit
MLAAGTLCSLLLTSIAFVRPFFEGRLYDAVARSGASMGDLWPDLEVVGVTYLAGFFLNTGMGIFFAVAAHTTTTVLRKRLFASIVVQDIGFFDEATSGGVISRLMEDSSSIQHLITSSGDRLLQDVLKLVLGMATMLTFNWKLSLACMWTVPISFKVATVVGGVVHHYGVVQNDAMARANSLATEVAIYSVAFATSGRDSL